MNDEDRIRNTIAGDVSGLVLQAAAIHLGDVRREPGGGSADVPWARLARQVHGRAAIVAELADQVRSGPASVVVLHSGGYGKTTIALSVARAVREQVRVWWIDAATRTGLVEGLREVAIQAGGDPQRVKDAWNGDGSAPGVLWQALQTIPGQWLLVIDNADDPTMLAGPDGVIDGRGWLRSPPTGGTLLITSRDARATTWPPYVRLRRVGVLSDADGTEMLLELAPAGGNAEAATQLARRLGGLPLALRLAGAYLARTTNAPKVPGWDVPRTFADYERTWQDSFPDVTTPTDTSDERAALSRTWELSLDLLTTWGVEWARPVLRLLSFLAAAPIPFELLDATALAVRAIFNGVTPDGLVTAVEGLFGVGLLEHAQAGMTMHPVVRDSCRWQANTETYNATCLLLLNRITEGMAGNGPATWPLWRLLLPHVIDVVASTQQDHVVATLAEKAALFADKAGMITEAERLYRSTLAIRTRLAGESHPDTLHTRYLLAGIMVARWNFTAAETELHDILGVQQQILGTEHHDSLSTRYMLAVVLHFRGRLTASEAEFRELLPTAATHGNAWDLRYQIARVLHDAGELPAARAELTAILAEQRGVLDDGHPSTLVMRHYLGRVLLDQGELATAESEYRAVLTFRENILGKEHPDTLATRHFHACVLQAQGDLDAAQSELDDVLTARERVIGRDHPNTLHTRHQLARLQHDRGNLDRAEREYRAILDIRTRLLGADHPNTLTSRLHLARLLHDRGDLAAAAAEYRDALAVCAQSVDPRQSVVKALQGDLDELVRNEHVR